MMASTRRHAIFPPHCGALRAVCALVCLLGLFSAGYASAQDAGLLEAQQRINDEASEAVAAGDHERAILLLRSSIELQELDITWLNLGRVYQKAGRCTDARNAYRSALRAPAAEGVPDGMIADRVATWTAELLDTCPGSLRITCSEDGVRVKVDTQAVGCGETLELSPGQYEVVGELGGARHAHVARVTALKTATVLVAPVQTSAPAPALDPPPEIEEVERLEAPAGGDLAWAAWTAGGVGLAAIITGVIVYISANDEYEVLQDISALPAGTDDRYDMLKDEVETADATAVTLWVGGGALLAASAMIFYWEW